VSEPYALPVVPLNRADFAPFGEVIEVPAQAAGIAMNAGSAERFANLAQIDCADQGGRAVVSWVRAQPNPLPITLRLLERHPLGTQAFIPLSRTPFLVIVASAPGDQPHAFYARGDQGISYHRGTWHHPLLALKQVSDFLVIDRVGPGENCEESPLYVRWQIDAGALPSA